MPNSIPIPLIRDIIDHNCLIFIGAGVSRSAGMPDGKELANILAEELIKDLEKEGKGPEAKKVKKIKDILKEVAQRYHTYYRNKKVKLEVQKIIRERQKKADPTVFELIAQLPMCDILTTNYDSLIENNQNSDDYRLIWKESDVRIIHPNRTNIIKMHGHIEDYDSLVITKEDYDDYDKTHEELIGELKNQFKKKTILIVGYSLEDDNFRRIYSKARGTGQAAPKKSYCVIKDPDFFKEEEWGIKGLEFIIDDAKDFFGLLVKEIKKYKEENPLESIKISKEAGTEQDQNPFKFYRTDGVRLEDFETIGHYFKEPLNYATIIEEGTNTVIEGDRGSGKSMILRYLSLETQLGLGKDNRFIGFYVKLRPGLVTTTTREGMEKKSWIRFFSHYLNLVIIERIVEILLLCKEKNLLTIDEDKEKGFCGHLSRVLLGQAPNNDHVLLEDILEKISLERVRCQCESDRSQIQIRTSVDYIFSFVRQLFKLVPSLRGKYVYLLLDEIDNLDEDQKKVLVLLLRERDAPINYKIGVKTGGMIYMDLDDRKLEYEDDYMLVYVDRIGREKKDEFFGFLERVANKRLKENEYDIDIRKLLPKSERKPKKGKDYSGFRNYCYLSSGIIRDFITLLKDTIYHCYPNIVEEKIQLDSIAPKKQNEVIQVKSNIHHKNFQECENAEDVCLLIDTLGQLFRTILVWSENRAEEERQKKINMKSERSPKLK